MSVAVLLLLDIHLMIPLLHQKTNNDDRKPQSPEKVVSGVKGTPGSSLAMFQNRMRKRKKTRMQKMKMKRRVKMTRTMKIVMMKMTMAWEVISEETEMLFMWKRMI